jgi:ribosomal protein S18 acetylase RimI-like enzyme
LRGFEQSVAWRNAEEGDLQILVSMEERCFARVDRFSRRKIRYYLRNPHGSVIVHVIELNGEPAGYSVLLSRSGRTGATLHSICVLPEHEGKGIARAYLSEMMPESGLRSILLRVRCSNQRALGLYTSLGFRLDGVAPLYYDDAEDAIMMRWEPMDRKRSISE